MNVMLEHLWIRFMNFVLKHSNRTFIIMNALLECFIFQCPCDHVILLVYTWVFVY